VITDMSDHAQPCMICVVDMCMISTVEFSLLVSY
jgi:hypothetical protein